MLKTERLFIISFYMLLFIFSPKYINCEENPEDFSISRCDAYMDNSITDEYCFNYPLIFQNKNYMVNHFAKNKNGDFVVEFTEYTEYAEFSTSRIFYGLTKNGQYFFSNESSFTREYNIDIDEETFYENDFINLDGKYNSKNLFVTISNAANKGKQYLFSINSYNSMVELHDLNDNNNKYYFWSFHKFFQIDEDEYLWPYEYEIFELKKESAYIISFIPTFEVGEDMVNYNFMKKFRFKSFDNNAYQDISALKFKNFENQKILNVFLMEDTNSIVVLAYEYNPSRRRNSKIIPPGNLFQLRNIQYYQFHLKFFNTNLKVQTNQMEIYNYLSIWFSSEDDLFIKSLYLNNKIVAFLYHKLDNEAFYIELFYLGKQMGASDISPFKSGEFGIVNNKYFDIYNSLNDFVKLDNNRLAFIYTSYSYISYTSADSGFSRILQSENSRELCILIMHINENSQNIYIADYSIDFDKYILTKQISAFAYNGYLLLATTIMEQNNNFYNDDFGDYLSMFMIFGYASGTDTIIDISKFFYNENTNSNNEFFLFLLKNLTIENNIFGYYPMKAIYLTYIPNEIKLSIHYLLNDGNEREQGDDEGNQGDERVEDKIPLEEPYALICDNIEESQFCMNIYNYKDDSEYEYEYIIEPNNELFKTSQYYFIEYQYVVEELYSNNSNSTNMTNYGQEYSGNIYDTNITNFEPKYYFGRTNILKFKLCHDYCETCKELGTSEKDQKCLSCLSEYQYDYYYFANIPRDNSDICIPEGKYYEEVNILSSCKDNSNTKYYINTTDNKKICFKDIYDCPNSYPVYNEETKECFYCDFVRFKNGECTSENLEMDSCTKCDYDCFIIEGCNFNNFDNTKEDFYERIINGRYLPNYNNDDRLSKISNSNGYSAQITTMEKELNSFKENTNRDFSKIDLKDCADLLRSQNDLPPDEDLVILKYENDELVSNGNEKSIQYEVYRPNSDIKLDLSVCKDTKITIYVPIELSEKTQKLYDSLKEQGYNLFDRNDKFYREFCTPYNSIDGTDVILPDRINDIYEKNKLICQENCEYSDYLPESKYLKCECQVTNEEKIETKEPEKITAKSVKKTFINVLKYSNYRVLYCYNLVFRKVTIKENVGSILSNIYFIGYLIAFCILCYTKADYLRNEIDKLLKDENNKNIIGLNKDNVSIFQKNEINDKEKFEKEKINEEKKENKEKINEENNDLELDIIKTKKNGSIEISNNINRKSDLKLKDNINYSNNIKRIEKNGTKKQKIINAREINTVKDNISENKNLDSKVVSMSKIPIYDEVKLNNYSKDQSEKQSNNSEKDNKEKEDLTDYELNDLEYDEALELDNRNFLKIYWYLLKREHIILFTFFNWNDFNLFVLNYQNYFYQYVQIWHLMYSFSQMNQCIICMKVVENMILLVNLLKWYIQL